MNNERLCDHTLFMRSILVELRDAKSQVDGPPLSFLRVVFAWSVCVTSNKRSLQPLQFCFHKILKVLNSLILWTDVSCFLPHPSFLRTGMFVAHFGQKFVHLPETTGMSWSEWVVKLLDWNPSQVVFFIHAESVTVCVHSVGWIHSTDIDSQNVNTKANPTHLIQGADWQNWFDFLHSGPSGVRIKLWFVSGLLCVSVELQASILSPWPVCWDAGGRHTCFSQDKLCAATTPKLLRNGESRNFPQGERDCKIRHNFHTTRWCQNCVVWEGTTRAYCNHHQSVCVYVWTCWVTRGESNSTCWK